MKYATCFIPIAAAIAFLFGSCLKKENPILPKNKMVELLVDIHISEATYSNRAIPIEDIDRFLAEDYRILFERHRVTSGQFRLSYQYYLEHPDEFRDIYAELVNRLTEIESRYKSVRRTAGADTILPEPKRPVSERP